MPKVTILVILLLTVFLYSCFSFDSGCEDGGLANRQEIQYYPNKQVRITGTIKNCLWNGEVKYYYGSGKLEHIENYAEGVRQGLFEYYSNDGDISRTENYINDTLRNFMIINVADNSKYSLADSIIKYTYNDITRQKFFAGQTTLFGNDHPLISIIDGNLHLRGRYDYYIINKELKLELNLRDTLLQYIPSAYSSIKDNSGNTHI